MDVVREFCARMLGDRGLAERAAQAAEQTGGDRMQALAAAVAACRRSSDQASPPATDTDTDPDHGLVGAVAAEMAQATTRLPERQREALALRETLGLGYVEIGRLLGIEPAAVAPLLARARLRLRSELRGTAPPASDCHERDRSLRTIALRRDGEEVLDADEEWLLDHLGHCAGCAQAHSAMLEASACYRAWQLPEAAAPSP